MAGPCSASSGSAIVHRIASNSEKSTAPHLFGHCADLSQSPDNADTSTMASGCTGEEHARRRPAPGAALPRGGGALSLTGQHRASGKPSPAATATGHAAGSIGDGPGAAATIRRGCRGSLGGLASCRPGAEVGRAAGPLAHKMQERGRSPPLRRPISLPKLPPFSARVFWKRRRLRRRAWATTLRAAGSLAAGNDWRAVRGGPPDCAALKLYERRPQRPCHGNYRRVEGGKGKSGFMLPQRHLASAPPLRPGRSAAWPGSRGGVED